jgi:8-oxo-dGTP pyrophosphatase MutT (NUDIX family)
VAEPEGPVARECVEGYLFARDPLKLLIFRRPPSRGRIWVPVSGKVEPSDRDFEAALRRELAEETGLTRPTAVRDLEWQVRFRADNGEVWRLHGFAVEVPPSFVPRLSDEHDRFEWVEPKEAQRRLHFKDNRAAVDRLRAALEADAAPNA